jgi:hypothetical protein
MATKGLLISSVLTEVGRTDLATRADEWFDEIYQAVLTYHDWSFITTRATRGTTVDLYRLGLPADFRKLYALYLDTGDSTAQKIKQLGLSEFTRLYPRVEAQAAGRPSVYTIYNNTLLLAPKCSTATWTLALIYTYNPPNITTNEVPVIPDRMHNALKSGLRSLFYASIKEFEKADKQSGAFTKLLELYKRDDEDDTDDELFLQRFVPSGFNYPTEYWANPLVMSVL